MEELSRAGAAARLQGGAGDCCGMWGVPCMERVSRHPSLARKISELASSQKMLYLLAASSILGYTATVFGPPAQAAIAHPRVADVAMLYGEPRPVQIIPSVLPADWANSTQPHTHLQRMCSSASPSSPSPLLPTLALCSFDCPQWEPSASGSRTLASTASSLM